MRRRLLALALFCVLSAEAPAQGASPGAVSSWDELAAAARREGSVVVLGPAHQELRKVLPAAFKERFGVDVEYLGGPAGIAVARLRSERAAGIYSADVTLAAIQTLATVFYREKMLDPIKPLLTMPEVVDPTKWKRGELWFPDPEHRYVLRLLNSVARVFGINTGIVKPQDMLTARDFLLNPKFKGRIATHDPTVTGVGSNIAAQFYVQLGENFVRRLYVDQKPAISRDERQLTDWLLRGTYPIVFGEDDAQVYEMSKEGLPVREVYSLPGLTPSLLGGNGMLAVFNHAPHPNAAKLFVNWLASKEGLELFARAVQWSPTRNDIDENSFVPAENIPIPGVDYFDAYDWNFSVDTKTKVRLWLKDLLGR
jgi:iron(III) transport system substrate-binding protein